MEACGLSRWLVEKCSCMKIVKPFPIQKAVIGEVLKGKNVVACAPTGQGKSAAYILPILDRISGESPHPWFALVLCPGRELCEQIYERVVAFAGASVRCATPVVGGRCLISQKASLLENPHVIVATPGRMKEVLQDEALAKRARRLEIVCFDECDKLTSAQDSVRDIQTIMTYVAKDVQRIAITATYLGNEKQIREALFARTQEVVEINMGGSVAALQHLKLVHEPTAPQWHFLHHLLVSPASLFSKGQGVVFVATLRDCELVFRAFESLRFSVTRLHSLLTNRDRRKSLASFSKQVHRVLIATDVAARGLDIPSLDWVINLNAPRDFDEYIHRVGRCARAGAPGTALTFLQRQSYRDRKRIEVIEERLDAKLLPYRIDEDAALMHPSKLNKAFAKAKLQLETDDFMERLTARATRKSSQR